MPDYVFINLTSQGPGGESGPGLEGGPPRTDGPGPVLAIGVFDGVHIGHQSLLRSGLTLARRSGRPLWVLTFWPHPESVLGGPGRPERHLLSTLAEKAALLRASGAEEVLVLRFTPEAAAVTAEDFVRLALVRSLQPLAVVVGFNFTFGHGGRGTPALLRKLGRRAGIEVVVHPAVRLGSDVVSSSAVREALAAGDAERAGLYLGRPYSLAGRVGRGAGRGRQLGFPTLNVAVPDDVVCPPSGVYVCSVVPSASPALSFPAGDALAAVANIGTCPTFTAGGETPRLRLEAHVLEGVPPGYGDEVRVYFFRRLRPERRFAGPRELVAQIAQDRQTALAFFGLEGSDRGGADRPRGSGGPSPRMRRTAPAGQAGHPRG